MDATEELGKTQSTTSRSPSVHSTTRVAKAASTDLTKSPSYGRLAQLMTTDGGGSRSGISIGLATAATAAGEEIEGHRPGSRSENRRTGRAAAIALLASDPRYKRYTVQIERCLNSFDGVSEWADFIAFLSRLLKALQSASPPYNEVPYKLVIAKRLAQGLNPALPNGVHQRALDVYREIFQSLGVEGLKRDLQIWSSGLFPFFQYAATAVKPILLDIYETFYLPLGESLRPVTKALALALLPGIEEETGDFFDRVFDLLDKIAKRLGYQYFFQCLFLVMITNPSARPAAVNFLTRRLPGQMQVAKAEFGDSAQFLEDVVGPEPGLLVRALSAGLNDDNVLVRRGTLDLLNSTFPFDLILGQSQWTEADRQLLVRSSCAIVLRRDLSLSRRLYTWLLGKSEDRAGQMEHFRKVSCSLVYESLKANMLEVTREGSDHLEFTKPFKNFISLLDKWEIGFPLSQALALDALATIQASSSRLNITGTSAVDSKDTGKDNLIMTGQAIYDAIEPYVIWSHLYQQIKKDLNLRQGKEGVEMAIWILNSFRIHDEEVIHLHIPLLIQAIVAKLVALLSNPVASVSHRVLVNRSLVLTKLLIDVVPISASQSTPPIGSGLEILDSQSTAEHIDQYYAEADGLDIPGDPVVQVTSNSSLWAFVFREIGTLISDVRSEWEENVLLTFQILRDAMAHSQDVLKLPEFQDDLVSCQRAILDCLSMDPSFEVLDETSQIVIDIMALKELKDTDASSLTAAVVWRLHESFLSFLRPCMAAYHIAVVQSLWTLHAAGSGQVLESIICAGLSSSDNLKRRSTLETFGNLWRLTDDGQMPGRELARAMFMILDCLRSSDPVEKTLAETWLRCNLRSYFRVLDPIIIRLMSNDFAKGEVSRTYQSREVTLCIYRGRVDYAQIRYTLELLLEILKFGGHSISRSLRLTHLGQSYDSRMKICIESDSLISEKSSYLEVLAHLSSLAVQSVPRDNEARSGSVQNRAIHYAALEVLQMIVGKGDLELSALRRLESMLINQLYQCIHRIDLDLQNKLLHLLHSVIFAVSAGGKTIHGDEANLARGSLGSTDDVNDRRSSRLSISETTNPLLLQILLDGISMASNRPLLQHWVDFVLMTVPYFDGGLRPLCLPLCDTLCQEIRTTSSLMASTDPSVMSTSTATDAHLVLLLHAAERVVLLIHHHGPTRVEDDPLSAGKAGETAGLFGYVANVFQADVPTAIDGARQPRAVGLRSLRECAAACMAVWDAAATVDTSANPSPIQMLGRGKARSQRVLERLYTAAPLDTIEALVDAGFGQNTESNFHETIYEIVDTLTSTSQVLVSLLCDAVVKRISPDEKQQVGVKQSHEKLLKFLLAYLTRIEGPIVMQVWPAVFNVVKTATAIPSGPSTRTLVVLVFKCLNVSGTKLATTSAFSDKKARKEFQDIYAKMLEVVVTTIPKSLDNGTPLLGAHIFSRRGPGGKDSKDSPEKGIPASPTAQLVNEFYRDLCEYVAQDVVPQLRALLSDTDRVMAASSTIMQGLVTPPQRGKFRAEEMQTCALDILVALSHVPATLKIWKGLVADALNDSTIFQVPSEERKEWTYLVSVLIDQERERLTELLNRAAMAPSANFFANREQEMYQRVLNLRRLSLVIFASEKNHFLTQLPNIQEKLVEVLRTTLVSPSVHSEVYLCLRILLTRFSPQYLVNFWPIILSELLRVFEQTMDELPENHSSFLQLLLSACKFLDLMLVIQTEDFQIHQWMFVTDTVDALYPPDDWSPESIMDRLAEIVSEHYHSHFATPITRYPVSKMPVVPRRPTLTTIKEVTSLSALEPFFSHASISAYEGMYHGLEVDWEFIEAETLREVFDKPVLDSGK